MDISHVAPQSDVQHPLVPWRGDSSTWKDLQDESYVDRGTPIWELTFGGILWHCGLYVDCIV